MVSKSRLRRVLSYSAVIRLQAKGFPWTYVLRQKKRDCAMMWKCLTWDAGLRRCRPFIDIKRLVRYRAISLKLFHRPFFDYYRFVWQISSICYQFHACVSYNSISFNSSKAYIQKNIHYWFHQSPKQHVQTKAYTPHSFTATAYAS